MTVREIQAHLEEMYGTEVSPPLISSVTDAVIEEVKAWQSRPLDSIYHIVNLDCIHVKVRDGSVRVKAVYLAIGLNTWPARRRCWACGAPRPRAPVLVVGHHRDEKSRCSGYLHCLRRRPQGISGSHWGRLYLFRRSVFIVHMVRHSLNYVSWKIRPEVAADLKRIYTCATADEAEQMLGEFEDKWDDAYLSISQSWRRNWLRIIPFFDFPPEIRKVVYTTNAIESVNMSLRKITKNRGSFPCDEALLKLFLLALLNIRRKWTMPIRD
jgi:putative transposase